MSVFIDIFAFHQTGTVSSLAVILSGVSLTREVTRPPSFPRASQLSSLEECSTGSQIAFQSSYLVGKPGLCV